MRLRAVIHTGEVHYDGKGPYGEDLDVAFRLLDAPKFKAYLKTASGPLAVVVSEIIYESIVTHGYDGLDSWDFDQVVNVAVGSRHRKGWMCRPAWTLPDNDGASSLFER